MDNCIILYESKYGSTLKYVTWLAERLSCKIAVTSQIGIEALEQYDTVILAGSIFASGILGINFIHKNYLKLKQKRLVVLIVGASPGCTEVLQSVSEMNLSDKLGEIPCFYVRGAWHKKEMKVLDRILVDAIFRSLRHRNQARLELFETALLGCTDQDADWTSPEQLDELVSYINDQPDPHNMVGSLQ